MAHRLDGSAGAGEPPTTLPASVDAIEEPLSFREHLKQSIAAAFDRTFWIFVLLALAAGVACWIVEGRGSVVDSLGSDLELLVEILPRIMAALVIAALVQVLIRRETVARVLGEEAGAKGVVLAAAAGAVTPGGPMTSFPLVNALQAAGSGRSALVSYVTSWSVLGLQRILAWEIPLLGPEFAAVRFFASLPLPLVAAAISKLLPHPSDGAKR
jgi:hypothetical protein